MNPFILSPKERLRDWNQLKNNIIGLEDLNQLEMVAEYWSKAPLVDHFLDPDDPGSWPDPWEMINLNSFCPLSLAYMMEQTLLLSDHDKWNNRLRLIYIDDKSISDMLMVLVVDNKYFLNYSQNQILNFDNIAKTYIIQNEYILVSKGKHKIR